MGFRGTSSGTGRAGQVRAAFIAATLLSPLLGGCERVERLYDSKLTYDTPLDWWHQLEGGVIAQQRPPPPGIGAPYPNLDRVPTQKPTVDTAQQQALRAQLLAERDQVRRAVVQDPVIPAPPARPDAAPPASTDPNASHVVADAASAPPPPALPSATAQAPAASRQAAAPPAAPAAAAQAPAPRPSPATPPPGPTPARATPASAAPPAAPTPAQPAELPTVPDAPPALPELAGVTASLVPAPSRPGPPGVEVGFRRGSAALPPGAEEALRALAARRAGAPIAVRAGGDAGPSPAAQAAVLPLAVRRAVAVRAALLAAGVPATDVRATALAAARGTRADLIQPP